MTNPERRGRAAARRYPGLLVLAGAALLANLLPSALRLPLSGPATSAELAPIPGRSDAGPSDMAEIGLAGSGGLGGGLGGGLPVEAEGDDGDTGGGGGNRSTNPRTKRCVGNPPRQTEDPLSPVCVAHFSGSNGGATAKGVTGDEIRLVFENCNFSTSEDIFVDYFDEDDPDADRRYIAYSNHFNDRYQLYGRQAHFFEVRWTDCSGDPAVRRAQIRSIDERYDPFAIVSEGGVLATYDSADEAARLGIVTLLDAPERAFTAQRAPFVYSVTPDLEGHIAMAVEFVCHRLAGRPARHSGDVADRGRRREFGVSYEMPGDPSRAGASMLVREVRARCGDRAEIADYADPDYAGRVAAMRTEGVTTVVKFGGTRGDVLAAEAIGWHPEWAVLDSQFNGSNSQQMPVSQWQNAFGFVFERRLGVEETQASYVAAEDGCDGCGPWGDASSYDATLLLFWGLQSAGPRLTAVSFERGVRALEPRRSDDPYMPAAYLTPGNFSWFKDAMAVWWDPTGRPPGWASVGCFRLIDNGLRYRAEDWRTKPGDDGIKAADGSRPPCQGLS